MDAPGWESNPQFGERTSGRKAHFYFGGAYCSATRPKPEEWLASNKESASSRLIGREEMTERRDGAARAQAGLAVFYGEPNSGHFKFWMALDLNTIRDIAGRVAAAHGIEIVEVELRGGGKARTLRITIDKTEGVTNEDCANISREVSTILDVEDAVPGPAYGLEVTSPGLDRKLQRAEEYQRFTGSRIKLTTREPVNGNRHFEGRLESFAEGKLTLEIGIGKKKPKPGHAQPGEKIEIALANVEKANLVPEI